MDLFGVVVIGLVTALGGGTLRDLTLGADPVFWISDPTYIFVAATASILTFAIARFREFPSGVLQVADAFGLAIFTIIGAQKALGFGTAPVIAVIMGIMTGVVGGMIRDILSGEIPLILQREIYATASLSGAVMFVALSRLTPNERLNISLAVLVTLGLRLAAIRWKLSLPVFPSMAPKNHDR
jgi:uncharacterized membrane protein YeiH